MHILEKECCSNCRAWERMPQDLKMGICRRNPPQIAVINNQPICAQPNTAANEHCYSHLFKIGAKNANDNEQ